MERRYGNMRGEHKVTLHVKDGLSKAKKQFPGHSCPLDKRRAALAALALHRIVPERNDPNAVRHCRMLRRAIASELRREVVHLPPVDRKIVHETALRTMKEKLLRVILVTKFLRPSLGKARETLHHNTHIRKPLAGLPCPPPMQSPTAILRRQRKFR